MRTSLATAALVGAMGIVLVASPGDEVSYRMSRERCRQRFEVYGRVRQERQHLEGRGFSFPAATQI